jgi:hypothetical protein
VVDSFSDLTLPSFADKIPFFAFSIVSSQISAITQTQTLKIPRRAAVPQAQVKSQPKVPVQAPQTLFILPLLSWSIT